MFCKYWRDSVVSVFPILFLEFRLNCSKYMYIHVYTFNYINCIYALHTSLLNGATRMSLSFVCQYATFCCFSMSFSVFG